MYNSNHMSISYRLVVITTRNAFSILLWLGRNFGTPHPPLPWAIFLKIWSLYVWVRGKAPVKNEVDWLNSFLGYIVNSQTHRQTKINMLCFTINAAQQSWRDLKIETYWKRQHFIYLRIRFNFAHLHRDPNSAYILPSSYSDRTGKVLIPLNQNCTLCFINIRLAKNVSRTT